MKITPRVTRALLEKRAHKYATKYEKRHGSYSTAKDFYRWKAFKRGPEKAGKYVRPPTDINKLKTNKIYKWS